MPELLHRFRVVTQVLTKFRFLVGFMESISIAKALARRHKYEIGVTQEIIALGFASLLGSMFNAYPCTGSFSRSAVAAEIGAKTALQGGITGATGWLKPSCIAYVWARSLPLLMWQCTTP